MKVIWQPAARRDRAEIFEFIAVENPSAAARMDLLFSFAAKRLALLPDLGRPGAVPETRELIPHRNYRLVHRHAGGAIHILAIVHTSRRWPPAEGKP